MPENELSPDFFSANRERCFQRMAEGSLAVFHAARPVIKSLDQFHRYRQTSNFYYLTGLDFPGGALVLHPEDAEDRIATVFIPEPDSAREVWDGKLPDKDEVRERSGIADVQYRKEFGKAFVKYQSHRETLYVDYDDSGFSHSTSHETRFLEKVRTELPGLQLRKAGLILAELRRKKSPEEVDLLRQAIHITAGGLRGLWSAMAPGKLEYELEAVLAYEYIRRGAGGYAFEPIVASGLNTTTLHYVDNNRRIEDGDLLLTDMGAEYRHYCADITRTVPVNGVFTGKQREIYQAVLHVQEEIIESVRPGISLEELKTLARKRIAEVLQDLGLIGEPEETSKYYMHSIGHYLGLDTHDVGDLEAPLAPGNVLTIEPGIYIREEGLGVRIEDDVLVTGEGCEVLSEDIPKAVGELEALLNS